MWEVNSVIKAADLDPAFMARGFLNVLGLLKMADEFCEEAFRRIGFGKPRAEASGETVFTAAAHVNVHRLIGTSQEFYSDVRFHELGRKKIVTRTYFLEPGDELLAEVETIHVCYDLNGRSSIEVPADIREQLRQIMNN